MQLLPFTYTSASVAYSWLSSNMLAIIRACCTKQIVSLRELADRLISVTSLAVNVRSITGVHMPSSWFRQKDYISLFCRENHLGEVLSITAQGCIADAHSLPDVTEKKGVRGGVRPHAHPFFRGFLGTLHCNISQFI